MNKRLFFLLCVVMILSNAFSQNPYRVDKGVSISSRDGVEKLERRQGMNGVKVASDMNTSAFKTVSESEERLDSIVMYSTDGFPFQKICYDYDIYGNITKENVFVYYNNIWCYCGFSLWEYDSRGNLLLEEYVGRAFIGLSPEGDFYGTEKSSYAYDENDSLISFQYYQWGGTDWVDFYKYYVFYDDNMNKTLLLGYLYDTDQWVEDNKTEYIYDVDGNLSLEYYYIKVNGNWRNSWKEVYSYDENNNRLLRYEYRWQNDEWCNFLQNRFAYDENGNRVLDYFVKWENGAWENYGHKYVWEFDEYRNKTVEEQYDWRLTPDGDYGWKGFWKNIWEYDENGNIIVSESYNYLLNNVWYGYYKWDISYDENGNILVEYFYECKNQTWVGTLTHVYIYDENGNLSRREKHDFGGQSNMPQRVFGLKSSETASLEKDLYYYSVPSFKEEGVDGEGYFVNENREIVFDVSEYTLVYSSSGMLIYSGVTDRIQLYHSGIYIVKRAGKTGKIAVK